MKKYIIGFIVGVIIAGGTVYAAIQYQASEIGYGNGSVKDAIDDLYEKSEKTFEPTLVVDGQTGSMAELDLKNDTYIKFKYKPVQCSNGNTATVFTQNKTYTTITNIIPDTEYPINDTYHRIYIRKDSADSWCQIKIIFYN